MHLVMIGIALVLAWFVRWTWPVPASNWHDRWQRALRLFLVPPLFCLMTTLAILWMGPQGQMMGFHSGWLSYSVALGFVIYAGVLWLKLAGQGWQSLQQVRTHPVQKVEGQTSRVLNIPALFAAQIGFWNPELVISQGLLNVLSQDQLAAVLAHEQAHDYYHDTFWFFWLGWLRQLTCWLPNTEALWQELLVARELRADHWAAQQVDPLLLAESLLLVVRAPLTQPEPFCAAFGAGADRLAERIEALLAEPEPLPQTEKGFWPWLWLLLLPLLSTMLHT